MLESRSCIVVAAREFFMDRTLGTLTGLSVGVTKASAAARAAKIATVRSMEA